MTAPENQQLNVQMSKVAFERMQAHCRSRTDVEVCGVLLGEIKEFDGEWRCIISDVIEGEHASEKGISVTFTHETWNHVHTIMDSLEDDTKMVGWFHTHPGFGIFYSNQDAFIQNQFFNEVWMPGIVVDPIADDLGVFHCHGDSIRRLGSLGITGDDGELIEEIESNYKSFLPTQPASTSENAAMNNQRDLLDIKKTLEWFLYMLVGIIILQIFIIAFITLDTKHGNDEPAAEEVESISVETATSDETNDDEPAAEKVESISVETATSDETTADENVAKQDEALSEESGEAVTEDEPD